MSMKGKLLGGTALLIATFSLNEVNAQTCTVPPTCESLGYDKNPEDCVDKAILKCPLDKTKIFCSNGPADGTAPIQGYGGGTGPNGSYEIGNVLTCNGKSIGYVIEVSDNGSGGKVAGLDFESTNSMAISEGRNLCKAKTDCNLVWNLTTTDELSLMCKARKSSDFVGVLTLSGSRFTSSDCSINIHSSTSGKPYCTATFATDKASGVTPTPTPTPTVSYKVGDTYYNNGAACGIIAKLDSTGQHGTVISSGAYSGTQAEVSNYCATKTTCGLDWGIASGGTTQIKASGGCQMFYTSGGCCQVCRSAGVTCGGSISCSSGYCEASF